MKNNPSIISFLRRNTSALALSVFLLVTTLGFGQVCTSLTPILITTSPDQFLCDAKTTTISVNSSVPGVWSTSPGPTATIASPNSTTTVVSNLSAVATVFIWTPILNSCQSLDPNSDVRVSINAKISPKITAIQTPLTCTTSQISVVGGSATDIYTWTTADGNIVSGAHTNVIEISKVGTYVLTVDTKITSQFTKSCPSTLSVVVPFVGDCNLSSPEFEFTSQFNLYPNPTADVLNIQPKSDTVINSVTVYNFMGQLVLNTTEKTTTINVSGLPKGTYILKVNSNNGTTATKFIKE